MLFLKAKFNISYIYINNKAVIIKPLWYWLIDQQILLINKIEALSENYFHDKICMTETSGEYIDFPIKCSKSIVSIWNEFALCRSHRRLCELLPPPSCFSPFYFSNQWIVVGFKASVLQHSVSNHMGEGARSPWD